VVVFCKTTCTAGASAAWANRTRVMLGDTGVRLLVNVKSVGVPTLLIESDLEDPRYFSEAQMRNRIDAFFESAAHRAVVQGAHA